MPDTWLTVNEVASRLGCSRWTVLRLIWDDELSAIKKGGLYIVTPTELDRYIAAAGDQDEAC